jgi:TetR/AcrR family transcriptional regulator, regulator of autoinduction and epiphytic fitness
MATRGSGPGEKRRASVLAGEEVRTPTAPASSKIRGEQTRRRMVEAARTLLEESEHPPTAKEIAARANVSHRLLFHHFRDLESLLGMVTALQIERYRTEVAEVPPHLPLRVRIDRTVRHRTALYESMGHLASNSSALSARLQAVADGVAHAHALLRSRLEHTFRQELEAAGRRAAEQLGAIDTAVSWQVWDYLQRADRLSPSAARRVMTRLLEAAVTDWN